MTSINSIGKKILVTGSDGFVGKNLVSHLVELQSYKIIKFNRNDKLGDLEKKIKTVDAIIHLAGENRPKDENAFEKVNVELTIKLCDAVKQVYLDTGKKIPVLFASSTQASIDNPYGRSKMQAESVLNKLANDTGNPCAIFRLPGIFGKWGRPNYNSVVATFCYNIARGIPIKIDNPDHEIKLVYIDDVVKSFLDVLWSQFDGCVQFDISPVYSVSLSNIAERIKAFQNGRLNQIIEPVGSGFCRALYATYISYLPKTNFSYPLLKNSDPRGVFVEMLKTADFGQVSFFTARPGVTRGGHYHHTKTEKFLAVRGSGLIRQRNLINDEIIEIEISGDSPQVVDTIPGWSHDITNIGQEELIVLVWANEIFDERNPDTVKCEV